MILYLTLTAGYDEAQSSPQKSLGGYKSSNFIDNDMFGNFFTDITQYTIGQNRNEYIGLILKNTTGGAITGAKIWTVTPATSYSKIEIGVQLSLSTDADGNKYMEYVQSINSKPVQPTIAERELEGNALAIGDMIADAEVGIWIKRSLLISVIEADQEDLVERSGDAQSLYQEIVKGTSDSIEVKISYS